MTEAQIYKRLNKARTDKRLSFQNLSKMTGLGTTYVCNVLNGKHTCGLQNLIKFCKALDLEIVVRNRTAPSQQEAEIRPATGTAE